MITLYLYLTLLTLVNKYVPQIEDITGKNTLFKKHRSIYEKIVKRVIESFESNEEDEKAEENSKNKDDKIKYLQSLTEVPQDLAEYLPEYNIKNKFFDDLYDYVQEHNDYPIQTCSINMFCKQYDQVSDKLGRAVSTL